MNIGEEKPAIQIPKPHRERTSPGRERRFEPNKPKQPVEDPRKVPTKVPAR